MPKEEKKSPFVAFTEAEVVKAEASNMVIILEDDFFAYRGRLAFKRQIADQVYFKLMEGLHEVMENGTKKEKDNAVAALISMRIMPLRIH